MATTYTPNYHLGKQTDENDTFDMSVITDNMDTIDSAMKTNATNILLNWQTGKNKLENLRNIGTTTSSDGNITVTTNADKSITLTRTASSSSTQFITINDGEYLEAGEYVFFGCPSGGSGTTYEMRFLLPDGSAYIEDKGEGATFTLSNAGIITSVAIRIGTGFSPSSQTYYPMIIPKSLYDSGLTQYQTYALPNTAITPALKECVDNGQKNIYDINSNSAFAIQNTKSLTIASGTKSVTFTLNADNSITVSGETEGTTPTLMLDSGNLLKYSGLKLSGGASSSAFLQIENRVSPYTLYAKDEGNGADIATITTGEQNFFLRLTSNTSFATPITIKPMICTKALYGISSKYEPHALPNTELTALEKQNETNIDDNFNRTGYKNLSTVYSGTASACSFPIQDTPITLPQGDYVLSFDETATTSTGSFNFKDANGNIIAGQGGTFTNSAHIVKNFTITSNNVAQFNIYNNAETTISNLMICTKADWEKSQTFEKHALSNAELTPIVKDSGSTFTVGTDYTLCDACTLTIPIAGNGQSIRVANIMASLTFNNSAPRGIILSTSNSTTDYDSNLKLLAKIESTEYIRLSAQCEFFNYSNSATNVYVWVKSSSSAINRVISSMQLLN